MKKGSTHFRKTKADIELLSDLLHARDKEDCIYPIWFAICKKYSNKPKVSVKDWEKKAKKIFVFLTTSLYTEWESSICELAHFSEVL